MCQRFADGEMVTYQHGGSQVKLLRQLGDVDVNRNQVVFVILFNFVDDVCHPLKLPLGPSHPDEVHLVNKWVKLQSYLILTCFAIKWHVVI